MLGRPIVKPDSCTQSDFYIDLVEELVDNRYDGRVGGNAARRVTSPNSPLFDPPLFDHATGHQEPAVGASS